MRWPRYKAYSHIEQTLERYQGNQNHRIEQNVRMKRWQKNNGTNVTVRNARNFGVGEASKAT